MTGRERLLLEPTEEVLPDIDVRAAYAAGDVDALVAELKAQTFYYAGDTHEVSFVVAKSTTRAGSYSLRVTDLDLAETGPDREDAWLGLLGWAELWGVTILWEGEEIFWDRPRRRRRR